MGYEPLPAYRGKNSIRTRNFILSQCLSISLVEFSRYFSSSKKFSNLVKYIYNIDGYTGLYRGFGCSLLSKMVCWYATTKADEVNRTNRKERKSILFLKFFGPVEVVVPNDQAKSTWNKCATKTLREIRCQSWGILLSHPLQGRLNR